MLNLPPKLAALIAKPAALILVGGFLLFAGSVNIIRRMRGKSERPR